MKQIYRHALLTLLLGATCATAGATTGDIINEDFSGFSDITYATTSKNGWTLNRCSIVNTSSYCSLKFDDLDYGISSASTPKFTNLTTTCNAVMTFRYADQSEKNSSFSVTIKGGGTFADGSKV